jgi:hypothetical protein
MEEQQALVTQALMLDKIRLTIECTSFLKDKKQSAKVCKE